MWGFFLMWGLVGSSPLGVVAFEDGGRVQRWVGEWVVCGCFVVGLDIGVGGGVNFFSPWYFWRARGLL